MWGCEMKMSEVISELKVNKITDMVCDLNEQEILDVVLFCSYKHPELQIPLLKWEKENEYRFVK